jgi:Fe-S-cluster containining protein
VEISTNGYQVDTAEIIEGFLNSYRQLDAGLTRVYEASAHIYSLIELLLAKGIIGIEELEERKKIIEKRLEDSYKKAKIGVRLQQNEVDKYKITEEVKIDCENRKHICRAACCRLTYSLSVQDIYEGIRWDLGKPFLNARGPNGYCVHLRPDVLECSIYEQRSASCRNYDCRNDKRIWLDFDKMVINPQLYGGKDPAQSGRKKGK